MTGRFEPSPPPAEFDDWRESKGDERCEHSHVFFGEFFALAHPAWHWVCEKCGRLGCRSFADPKQRPKLDQQRYAEAMVTFHGDRYWIDRLVRSA